MFAVSHVLYLRPLLGLYQQSVIVSILRLPQRISYHYRLHLVLRCFGADGHCCQAIDEYSQPDFRISGRFVPRLSFESLDMLDADLSSR